MPAEGGPYDYVVVGGGSAGCVLASRLSEDPQVRVLLVEAGRRDSARILSVPGAAVSVYSNPRFNWGYRTEPQPGLNGRSLQLIQAKVIGGGSSINGMVHSRGAAHHYARWEELGADGWGYEDVLPYFRRLENSDRGAGPYHGAGGPVSVIRAASPLPIVGHVLDALEQAGFPRVEDLSEPEPDGFGFYDWAIARGRRASAPASYSGFRRSRPNLTVLTEARVLKIDVDRGRARGVELLEGRHARHVRASREVILTGGAINTAHLLLLSGIGPADDLRGHGLPVVADLPGVGANLQNHVCYAVSFAINQPLSAFRYRKPWTGALEGLRYATARRGFLATGASPAGGFFRSDAAQNRCDMQAFLVPALAPRTDRAGTLLPRRDGFMLSINQGRPYSRGRVALRSADPLRAPVIDPGYFTDGRDLDVLVNAVRRIRAIADTPALRDLIEDDPELRPNGPGSEAVGEHVRANADNHYHVASTCRMGHDPAIAVTDPHLRVHGIEGLRVADASVMPELINGNTNAPVMMIAERAADFIRGLAAL